MKTKLANKKCTFIKVVLEIGSVEKQSITRSDQKYPQWVSMDTFLGVFSLFFILPLAVN